MRLAWFFPLLLAVHGPAAAGCQPGTTTPDVDTGTLVEPRLYVDIDRCQVCHPQTSVWVYEESNGIDGLQRLDDLVDDTCGVIAPDLQHF